MHHNTTLHHIKNVLITTKFLTPIAIISMSNKHMVRGTIQGHTFMNR